MSDVLIILVALGVLIVLGVLFFNWRQEREYQDKMAENFKPAERDVLIDDFQINTDLLKENVDEPQEKVEPSISTDTLPQDEDFIEADDALLAASEANQPSEEKVLPSQATTEEPQPAIPQPQTISKVASTIDEVDNFGDTVTLDLSSFEAYDAPIDTDEIADVMDTTPPDAVVPTQENKLPEAVHLQTDLIGMLYAAETITAAQIEALNDFNVKTHHFSFGLTEAGDWVALESNTEQIYTKLVYAMQMADRGGPVSREVLNAFQQKVESIGTALGAQVEWQNQGEPVAASIALDQFCIEVDKTIGFHVVAKQNQQFHGTKFRGLAEAQGLQLQADGRYVKLSDDNQEAFYVKNLEGKPLSDEMLKTAVMTGITFQLDLPTVADSSAVFDDMIASAKVLGSSLDAEIVDDKRKPIGDIQFEKIREQLNIINAQMIAKGIIPGSSHALRLFS